MGGLAAIAQKFNDLCVNIANYSGPITLGILVVVTLIIGISLMVSKKARQNAIEWIPWVLVGTAVALSAVGIAEGIATVTKF